MQKIKEMLDATKDLIIQAGAERSKLAELGYQGTPKALLEAMIELTKAQVSLEMALDRRTADIRVDKEMEEMGQVCAGLV